MFTCLLNEIMQKPEKTKWMCEGTTYLLKTMTQKTLKTIYHFSFNKPQTSNISSDRQGIFTPKPGQNGCRRGLYGCKDQLMINKMIIDSCKERKRNLSYAWIDYKKAFDNVSREWILRSLELFKASPE